MLIAQKKIHENIAEYILYMYQIEDVIRSYEFDLERIITHFVRPQYYLMPRLLLNTNNGTVS